MNDDQVIIVDRHDSQTGVCNKLDAHITGRLHRAFSIFIFDDQQRHLLQRRAFEKYHAGGLWSNACCSHPKPQESIIDAAHRRLDEELGISIRLEKVCEVIYNLDVGGGLKEHEYNHTYMGILEDISVVKINDAEVEDICFLEHNILINKIKSDPQTFTPWFLFLLPKVIDEIQQNQAYGVS